MSHNKEPVDAVITWVNGFDPVHQKKLKTYLPHINIRCPESVAPTRFNACGEIDYCVTSILRFASWIRHIYIVTDAQTPGIIHRLKGTAFENRVHLVDHREIFSDFDQALPTFNSLAIESVLWRIPELANQFIYLNDDCALIRPVAYEDFFRDGKMVLRGGWKTLSDKKWGYRMKQFFVNVFSLGGAEPSPNPHRMIQENSARLAGIKRRFFLLPHVPFPLKKSLFEQFFLKNPEQLARNVSFRFRDHSQFWPISLIYHFALKFSDNLVDNTLRVVTVNGACHSLTKIQQRLLKAKNDQRVAFICMQSLDEAPLSTRTFMLKWLEKNTSLSLS